MVLCGWVPGSCRVSLSVFSFFVERREECGLKVWQTKREKDCFWRRLFVQLDVEQRHKRFRWKSTVRYEKEEDEDKQIRRTSFGPGPAWSGFAGGSTWELTHYVCVMVA
mmetsp:Transcript_9337/g.19766  ORF Transcript_9337/g.19766 Transcript_9337/m.19766 type:complete len:109 (+) Transcript_9337:216-542(+)